MPSPIRILPVLLALSTGSLWAQNSLTINWGTAIIDQKIITSDGSFMTPGDYLIQIGAFAGSFTPTLANRDDWLANWNVFDAITFPDSHISDFHTDLGGDGTSRFAGSARLRDDQTSDSEDALITSTFLNQQAYVFIREMNAPVAPREWALYTNLAGGGAVPTSPWVFPFVDGGLPQTPLNWFISGADTAIVGAVGDPVGGITSTGGGSFTDTSTDFIIRTHLVMPEPHTGLFFAMFAFLIAWRRSR